MACASPAHAQHAPPPGSKRKLTLPQDSTLPSKRTRVEPFAGEDFEQDDLEDEPMSQVSEGESTPIAGTSHLTSSTSVTSTNVSTPTSTTSRPREKKYVCDFDGCGKAYSRPVRLAEHQRSHTDERPFICSHDGCGKTFLRDSHLKHHVKSAHEDKRDWICDWPGCDKSFVTGTRYRRHRAAHDEKEQIKCTGYPPCEQYFRKQDTLQRHIESVHLEGLPYTCDHVDDITGEMCGRRFKQSANMTAHQTRDHSGNRFWCNLCTPEMATFDPAVDGEAIPAGAVGFPSYGEMQLHIKVEHPPTCPDCGHVAPSQAALRAHMDIQHESLEARKKFPCEEPDCGRSFTKKGNLQVHVRTVHAKQARFVCGQTDLSASKKVLGWDGRGACSRNFTTKAGLEGHVRTQHMYLPRPNKGKNRTLALDDVMEDVVQEAPAHQSSMGRLTGVGYETGRDLACLECPYRFIRAYDLGVHLETAHGFSKEAATYAAAEEEAVTGGPFWIGGADEEDMMLAQELNNALRT